MRHIISILLENEAGALSRVSGLFSARAYNIDSLTVAPTDDSTMSRITVVTCGDDAVINQITKQLHKLVDVVKLVKLADGEYFEREILLLKLAPTEKQQAELSDCIEKMNVVILDQTEGCITLEITSSGPELDEAIKTLAQFNVIEVVRSGTVGISAGSSVLRL
ncbi:MAG: acetolactate synthase small subunit [Gammaproteobacteria bacterium]|nr:acetolactate synthase small subunit [Gammaproteobacteria bacterium]